MSCRATRKRKPAIADSDQVTIASSAVKSRGTCFPSIASTPFPIDGFHLCPSSASTNSLDCFHTFSHRWLPPTHIDSFHTFPHRSGRSQEDESTQEEGQRETHRMPLTLTRETHRKPLTPTRESHRKPLTLTRETHPLPLSIDCIRPQRLPLTPARATMHHLMQRL